MRMWIWAMIMQWSVYNNKHAKTAKEEATKTNPIIRIPKIPATNVRNMLNFAQAAGMQPNPNPIPP